MGLLKTSTGTLGSTGMVTEYTQLSTVPTKVYFSVVGKDGGVSIASGCTGLGKANTQWCSSFGRDGGTSATEERTDRCIHFFEIDSAGNKTTLLSASFEGFDTSISQFGFIGMKFNVHVANGAYSYIARLED